MCLARKEIFSIITCCEIASIETQKNPSSRWDIILKYENIMRVLPPSCATNFYVAKSRRRFYVVQDENDLLRKKVVIRATNNLNLRHNIVARQVARKMLPVLLGLY